MWHCLLSALFALAILASCPTPVSAWGKEGHEIVGKVADKYLNSQARNAIDELLQGDQFQSLSDGRLTNWADSIKGSAVYRRKYPNNASWHFIDIDVTSDLTNLDLSKFCANGDCALEALRRFQGVLKDPTASAQDRREALFFVAHFMGDIHQPLHCATRITNGTSDRGGNLVQVMYPGEDVHVTNLHKVWDTDLVLEAIGPLSLKDYADRLAGTLSTDKRKDYQKGKLEDWILESHKLARGQAYMNNNASIPPDGQPTKLSSDYVMKGAETVEEQMTKAGVRLAQFLNDTFKGD
jgi:hypothetical protein